MRLLDPVRLFISEKFLLFWIIYSEKKNRLTLDFVTNNTFYDQFHDGSIFKGQLYHCNDTSYEDYILLTLLYFFHPVHLFNPVRLLNHVHLLNPFRLLSFMKNSALCVY